MSLSVGDKLGPYEILGPLGAGGMGEVWKARDTRVDRIVAVKISQAKFTERFEQEARAIAALNHPNICQLYDVGPNYLVMEFIGGSPIALADGARKLLDTAVQIADGLSAAHTAGIVHRDLKPDNILISLDGRVKILDFGLAKSATRQSGDSTTTMALRLTDPGTTVGTVSYMSPEQARGEAGLTAQSDQFSFGLILYELATGKRPFQRASAPETMTAIIRDDAEPLPDTVPAPLRWVIERLLEKEPGGRYDSSRDLYRELKQIRDRRSETTNAARIAAPLVSGKRKPRAAFLAAGALCLIAGAFAAALVLPQRAAGPDPANYKFTSLSNYEAEERSPQWAPDGKSIVYLSRVRGVMQVFTRVVGASDAAPLTTDTRNCSLPFWSTDGASVYYVSAGSLWSVPAAGGVSQKVLEDVSAAALHPDGKTLAFECGRKIWVAPLAGGDAKELWPGPADDGLRFSPDGSKLAVLAIDGIWLVPYPSGSPRKLATGFVRSPPSWFPDSRHLAAALPNGGIDRYKLSILDITDDSQRVIESYPSGVIYPAVSPDGKRIAYSSVQPLWDLVEVSIANGSVRTLVGGGVAFRPDWAPSGKHFLYATTNGDYGRIEDGQADGDGVSRQLGEAGGSEARWSPDGGRFVFYNQHDATLRLANASGGGWVQLDSTRSGTLEGFSWSPDGQWISYLREISGRSELVKLHTVPGAVPAILTEAALSGTDTEWSPAGNWIAYPAAAGLDLISPDGKSRRNLTSRKFAACGFAKDGSRLYGVFHNEAASGGQWQLWEVNVNSRAEKLLGPIVFPASITGLAGFSLHPDGKRFLASVARFPSRTWMLEGFEQSQPKGWWYRLLHR